MRNEDKGTKAQRARLTNSQKVSGAVTPAEAGVQNSLKPLDSGFRRNDGKWPFLTFYETVKTGIMEDTLKKAVALKYEPGKDKAPRVAAKGIGLVAERIIALAREEGVPIHEDPDLVAALVQLDFQEEVPPEFYRVVAEILAFVYRLNRRMMKR